MRFQTFPSVIQREIFENLKLEELLYWSFCSKRFKYLIQSIQSYRFKKAEKIKYWFYSDAWIYILAKSSGSDTVFALGLYSKSRYDCLVNNNIIGYKRQDIIPVKLFGMNRDVLCCLSDQQLYSSLYVHNDKEKQYVIAGVHNYLYQFFGSSIRYELEATGTEQLPTLKNINRSYCELSKNETAEGLEACIAVSPNQEFISISRSFEGKLSENSVIYETKMLRINCDSQRVDEILFRFKGERLCIQDFTFPEATLIRFLKDWKSNRGLQNLKSLSIFADQIDLDEVKIKELIDIKESEHDLEFTWKERSVFRGRNELEWIGRTSTTRDYLIRDEDGVRASIEFSPQFITFVVLKSTEK